jgi:hypothetical protein
VPVTCTLTPPPPPPPAVKPKPNTRATIALAAKQVERAHNTESSLRTNIHERPAEILNVLGGRDGTI